jgi:hypothetical protein
MAYHTLGDLSIDSTIAVVRAVGTTMHVAVGRQNSNGTCAAFS